MRLFIFLVPVLGFFSCSSAKDGGVSVNKKADAHAAVKDSVEWYETDVEVRQQNYRGQLQGRWVIDTMRRQARVQPDVLPDAWLQFNADSTFSAYAGCNRLRGSFLLKGTGIRFNNVISTRMACPNDVEDVLLQLLQHSVSAYSVDNTRLMLRDGAGNVIFSARRGEEKGN